MDKSVAKGPCPCIKMIENFAVKFDRQMEQLAAERGEVYDPSKSLVARLAAKDKLDDLREGERKDASATVVDEILPKQEAERERKTITMAPLQAGNLIFGGEKRGSLVSKNEALKPIVAFERIIGGKRKAANEDLVSQKSRSE